jgi:Uma2 family endonuclease
MSIALAKPLPGTIVDPLYPDSDGQPMGETHFDVLAIVHLFEALDHFFRNRADVFVGADILMYYEQGNPSACKAPDVLVAKGTRGKHPRRSFRVWEEGVAPAVIFEVSSEKTRFEDDTVKPRVYADLGVSEYFVFDPEGGPLKPALNGFRLIDRVYQPLTSDADGRISSDELGLVLVPECPLLRLVDSRTGRRLLTYSEQADEMAAERARAAEMEAELAKLRAAQKPPQSPS